MQVSAREATQFDDIKRIGLAQFHVVEFNRETDSDGKEIKYLGEKDGNTTFRVAITAKENKSGKYYPLSYYLEDKVRTSKDGLKTQYINSAGWSTWVADKKDLTEKFSAYSYHPARVGEVDLVDFLQAWLNIDRNAPVDLTLDWKALMKGSTKELKELLITDLPRKEGFLGMAIVRTVEKDGEIKSYQGIYGKVLPGFNLRLFKTVYTPEILANLRDRKEQASKNKTGYLKSYEEFAIQVTDPEWGIKSDTAYYLGELKEYNPEENMVATDKVLSEEGSDY